MLQLLSHSSDSMMDNDNSWKEYDALIMFCLYYACLTCRKTQKQYDGLEKSISSIKFSFVACYQMLLDSCFNLETHLVKMYLSQLQTSIVSLVSLVSIASIVLSDTESVITMGEFSCIRMKRFNTLLTGIESLKTV